MHKILAETYPDAHCELDFTTPLELVVATILSAQCTDRRVNLVTPALFARYPDAAAYAGADRDELEDLIRSTGFFRDKATSVIGLGQALVERYDGEVPGRLKDLVTLPGVGRKTANVVLGNAFGVPGITVDTHVGRLVRRFGWTAETDPDKVEAEIGDAHRPQGLDDAVAPRDLARPALLPRQEARVRRLPARAALPVLRRGADRPGRGREARHDRGTPVTRRTPAAARLAAAVAVAALLTACGAGVDGNAAGERVTPHLLEHRRHRHARRRRPPRPTSSPRPTSPTAPRPTRRSPRATTACPTSRCRASATAPRCASRACAARPRWSTSGRRGAARAARSCPLFADVAGSSGSALRVVGIDATDDPPSALSLLADAGVHYPSVRDDAGATKAPMGWGSGLPVTYFVDADGRVAFAKHGADRERRRAAHAARRPPRRRGAGMSRRRAPATGCSRSPTSPRRSGRSSSRASCRRTRAVGSPRCSCSSARGPTAPTCC